MELKENTTTRESIENSETYNIEEIPIESHQKTRKP
jgi:hypothetical protein